MSNEVQSRLEAIGVKKLDGTWCIINHSFVLDTYNHLRPIYPAFLYIGEFVLKFLKPGQSGRTLYKQVDPEGVLNNV